MIPRIGRFTSLWHVHPELLSAGDRNAACPSISKQPTKFEPVVFSGLSDNYYRKKLILWQFNIGSLYMGEM